MKQAVLIYDASCPICSSTIMWISRNKIENSFEMVPCQSEDLGGLSPDLQRADCMKAMHLVLPGGKVVAGEKALPEIFMRLRRYRIAALLFKLPGAGVLSRIVYRWFAGRRYRIAAILSHLMKSGTHAA
jgi:predicted DCC family thiol-disulfide oxidoreductase YuxK